jgi:hypothetical protein
MELKYANTAIEAHEAAENGFEPVECSFGKESIVGGYVLDHHGKYSCEDAVSIKAAKMALDGINLEKFVVTGEADCDQVYAIAALSGPKIPISLDEAVAVAEIDIDPIGRDRTLDRYIKILMHWQKTERLPHCLESTYKSIGYAIEIFNGRYSSEDVSSAIHQEENLKETAKNDIKQSEAGKIVLVDSDIWGFNIWYETAPIVVVYSKIKKKVSIGVHPKNKDLLGAEGLNKIYPILDSKIKVGWGGRKDIGASPRNVEMNYADAIKAYDIIKELIC